MIEIRSLNKTFPSADGGVVALDDINLTIKDGEIFGIIGLSGAGKSTLVRCINLLERPTSGEILLDGKNLTQMPQKELLLTRRQIGMIFQSFNLFEQRTALGNICFPMEIAGVDKKAALARAEELLELVGLTEKKKSYPSQLSGGQKQRIAIARALAMRPKYLLCDEATSALDPNTTQSILSLLKQINQTMGVTIIVITHEMRVIDQICDRVAVIDNSRIAEVGNVSEIFAAPKSEIARELIMPKSPLAEKNLGSRCLRILFDGESSDQPLISDMILSCQASISIIHAETKTMEGKAYGHMIIRLPEDEHQISRIIGWLSTNNVKYTEEAR